MIKQAKMADVNLPLVKQFRVKKHRRVNFAYRMDSYDVHAHVFVNTSGSWSSLLTLQLPFLCYVTEQIKHIPAACKN